MDFEKFMGPYGKAASMPIKKIKLNTQVMGVNISKLTIEAIL